jgi:hypothetical protein
MEGLEQRSSETPMEDAVAVQQQDANNVISRDHLGIRLALENLYFVIRSKQPQALFAPLLRHMNRQLQLIGAHGLLVDADAARLYDKQHWEFWRKQQNALLSMSSCIQERALKPMRSSPYWAVIWDCATDTARREKGTLFVRHLNPTKSRAVNTFIGNVFVKQATGEGETSIIKDLITSAGPRGYGLAAGLDGAASNFGSKKGIVSRLGIAGIHCAGHVVNLSMTHIVLAISVVSLICKLLKEIARDLWSSHKRAEAFRDVQAALGEEKLEFLYSPKTRWFYIRSVLDRYLTKIISIHSAYVLRGEAGDVVDKKISRILDLRYIFVSHLLVDFLGPLAKLSRFYQSDDTLVCEFRSSVKDCGTVLNHFLVGKGPSEQKFDRSFDQEQSTYTVGTNSINVTWKSVWGPVEASMKLSRKSLLQHFIKELDKAFKQRGVVWLFGVLDILELPYDSVELATYGVTEIKSLYKKFRRVKALEVRNSTVNTLRGPKEVPATETVTAQLFNTGEKKQLLAEWSSVKPILSNLYQERISRSSTLHLEAKQEEMQDDARLFKQADAYDNFLITKGVDYPLMSKLIRIMLCHPSNTACGERNFSLMALLKPPKASTLSDTMLQARMVICENGPEPADLSEDVWEAMCAAWLAAIAEGVTTTVVR